MRLMRVIVLATFVFCLSGGVAFAAVDWLDKLSGPGPFRGLFKTYRFLCVSNTSNQQNFGQVMDASSQFVPETERRVVEWLTPIDAGAGLVSFKRLEREPALTVANREAVARSGCRADRKVSAYADFTVARYRSLENALFSQDPGAKRHQVRIWDLKWTYALRVHPVVDIGASIGKHWYSGDEFETFSRTEFVPLLVQYSPLASLGDDVRYRIVRFQVAMITFDDGFTERDFCNRNCTGIDQFSEKRDYLWRVGIYVDFAAIVPLILGVAP